MAWVFHEATALKNTPSYQILYIFTFFLHSFQIYHAYASQEALSRTFANIFTQPYICMPFHQQTWHQHARSCYITQHHTTLCVLSLYYTLFITYVPILATLTHHLPTVNTLHCTCTHCLSSFLFPFVFVVHTMDIIYPAFINGLFHLTSDILYIYIYLFIFNYF